MRLENCLYLLEINPLNGVVTRFLDKKADLDIITAPEIGENFRLLVPLPGQESNYILGMEQKLTSSSVTDSSAVFEWKGPLTAAHGPNDIDFRLHISLSGEGVEFRAAVDNHSEFEVAEVWYPLLGGINGIGERNDTKSLFTMGGNAAYTSIFQEFPESMGVGGGGGNPFGEAFLPYPTLLSMPWADFYNEKLNRGLYFASHDPIARLTTMRFELQPGVAHNAYGDNWARAEELDPRFPQGMIMGIVKFPYVKPGETFEAAPVVFQTHDGDWHVAAKIYRQWFDSTFHRTNPRANTLHREQVYQDILSMTPEGDIFLRFADIPQYARDGLDYGVKAIIVSSWNLGGHDNMYPNYVPDPRLGTWEELEEAIARCHEMGVKVYFFVNLQPVDVDTDWYREELHRYMCRDKWGVQAPHLGWGMGTLGARLGLTRRAMAPANPSIPQYRKIIVDKMRRLAEIGADGLHFDKICWNPGLDFNPLQTLSPDRGTSEGILIALREVLDACREINPEFSLATEGSWDRLLEISDTAWTWACSQDNVAVSKYTFNQWTPMMPVVQPFAYNAVNNAARFGYQVMVGTARYSKSMQDEPMKPLSRYIQEVNRIREELRDTIYWGEFLEMEGAKVESHWQVKYSTHRNPASGKRACVVCNFGSEAHEAKVAFDDAEGKSAAIYQPFEAVKKCALPWSGKIEPRQMLIFVEE